MLSPRLSLSLSLRLSLSLLALLSSSVSLGHATPPTQHINASSSLGMGQAGRGVARGSGGLIYNPAGMSASISYAVEAMYQRSSSELNILGLNIVDSKMRASQDRLALGLGYAQVISGGESQAYEGRLGFGLPVIKAGPDGGPELHIGAAGRYLYDKLSDLDDFDVDLGALLNIGAGFNVGFVADSLLQSNQMRRYGGGLGFVHQRFTLAADYMRQSSPHTSSQADAARQLWSGGAELLLGQSLILRGGYERHIEADEQASEWLSAGLAIIDGSTGRGQLATAYRQSLSTGEYRFGLSFVLFVDLPTL